MIIPTAEPFFFPGGPVGVLLVHGFTGSPKELRWLGEQLANQGYSVLGIRLFAHATDPNDIRRAIWADWLNSVEDGYHLLKDSTNNIVVAGLSMGGILTLLFAARHPLSGLIAMSVPYEMPPDPRLPYLKILWPLISSVPKDEPDWRDPSLEEDHIHYPQYSTKAIMQLLDLMAEMRTALPQVTAPTLLINSSGDATVPPTHMDQIYQRLGSSDKSRLLVENSGHVITRDLEKSRVAEAAIHFIERVTTPTHE
jgi:carboxylesterase